MTFGLDHTTVLCTVCNPKEKFPSTLFPISREREGQVLFQTCSIFSLTLSPGGKKESYQIRWQFFYSDSWELKKANNLQVQPPDVKNDDDVTTLYLSSYKEYY